MSKTLLVTILYAFILMLLSCGNPITSDDGPETETMTDIDSNTYKTVKIGHQWWMAENLRTTRYNDGSAILHAIDDAAWDYDSLGAYCYYKNTTYTDSIEKFGALYNWHVVKTGKLAPEGWNVPSYEDWEILTNYLVLKGYNWDGSTYGNKIAKSMATKTDWNSSGEKGCVGNNPSTNNRSGFSGLPGGCRNEFGYFSEQGLNGFWWSTREVGASEAYYFNLNYFDDSLLRDRITKKFGFSVRLVKD